MKIKIGNYRSWFGIYQLVDLLEYVKVPEHQRDWFVNKLKGTWVDKFLVWVDSKKKRKVSIVIDKYDTWSMDHTLSLIIVPMLQQLKETKHGAPSVDPDDVPEYLRPSYKGTTENLDPIYFYRWTWVLNEMIFAFTACREEDWQDQFYLEYGKWHTEECLDDSGSCVMIWDKKSVVDREGLAAYQARIDNGMRLFGKYYSSLWD